MYIQVCIILRLFISDTMIISKSIWPWSVQWYFPKGWPYETRAIEFKYKSNTSMTSCGKNSSLIIFD